MKNKLKLITALCLAATMTATTALAAAPVKDEVVYASLSSQGTVTGVYVVNTFELEADGTVTDYGDYSSTKNLTNNNQISYQGGQISVQANEGMFWYQGNMEGAELPWSIDITYTLEGKEISPDELAGSTGELEINIAVAQNPEGDESFFNDFTLQISVTLNTALCANIAAPGGTVAASGNDKLISFVSLGGSEGEYTITASVHDFEMDAITIAGVKMDMGAYTEGMDLSSVGAMFGEDLSQLEDGAAQLDDGAAQLADGAGEYADGVAQYADGVSQVSDGVAELAQGAAELASGAEQTAQGMAAFAQSGEALAEGAKSLSDGLGAIDSGGASLNQGISTLMTSALSAAQAQLSALSGTEVQLTKDNYGQVLDGAAAAAPQAAEQISQLKAQLDGINQLGISMGAYTAALSQSAAGAAQLSQGIEQYVAGAAQLAAGTAQLSAGAGELAQGANQLSAGAAELSQSAASLVSGAQGLHQGLLEYKYGTELFRQSTSGMDQIVDERISQVTDQLMPQSSEETRSFTSAENQARSVQFVMRTQAIVIPAAERQDDPDNGSSLWQKLLALFQ